MTLGVEGLGRPNRAQIILHILLLSAFIITITYLTIHFAPGITKLISKPDKFRHILTSYGPISILVFIFFQFIQVLIAAIPGELLQLAGGYVYGTFFGTVYSLTGILLGSVVAFYISRLLGLELVKTFVAEKDFEKLNFLVNSPKSEITMFLLFLIPGVPKDILVYLAGLTPIKPAKFFIIFTIARFPGLLASAFVGANFQRRDYLPVIIVSTIACVLFVVGLLAKEQIVHKLHKLFNPQKKS
jgi:uncharacterized membrane protein YdjX (TVP38/TMEM64 family)